MATDFSYDDKTINSSGPIKPTGKNQPLDPRTEVKLYADIESIPNPYVGMIITVLKDETNSNKMTDYKVLSLKADNLGVANSVVDQVQRYVDYLGVNGQGVDTNNFATKEELGLKADKTELHSHINKTVLDGITSANVNNWNNKVDKVEGKILTTNDYTNEEKQTVASLKTTVGDISSGLVKDVEDLKTNGVSQDNINAAIENYLTEHPVQSGATAEQAAQIEANRTAIGDENSGLVKRVNDIKNTELQNLNTAIQTLETLVGVDETVGDKTGLPSGDANIIASINRIDSKPSGTVTDEQISTAVNNYLTEHPVSGGATVEQANQIQANTNAIGNENSGLTKEVNDIKSVIGDSNSGLVKDVADLKANSGAGGSTPVVLTEPYDDDIPRIFLSEGTLPTTKTSTTMKFEYISKNKRYSGYVDIKCQGTSSMSYAKKNFTIKTFNDKALTTKMKINFMNWGEQSKFCLKANFIDISHARNIVSARLWGDIVKTRENYPELPELLRTSPNNGAIDGFFVKVYANGVYQGRYTMNIPKDGWMANMDKSLNEHCILCGENYQSGCFRAIAAIDGNDWSDELHDIVPSNIVTSLNAAITHVMNSTNEDFKANLSNYFDVDSLIDYYCFQMVICGLDSMGKNQILLTYDGTKFIASSYDMDSTFGLYFNGTSFVSSDYDRTSFEDMVNNREGNLLYQRLVELYPNEIYNRYQSLRKDSLSITNMINKFEEFMICNSDLIKEDYKIFPTIPSQNTNNIQQIRRFIVERCAYVDSQMADLISDKSVTSVTITSNADTVVIGSSITLTANLTPSNANIKTGVWSVNNENVTLSNSTSLSVNVTGVTIGTSIITFTSDDTTNGQISATYTVTISDSAVGVDMYVTESIPIKSYSLSTNGEYTVIPVANGALFGSDNTTGATKLLYVDLETATAEGATLIPSSDFLNATGDNAYISINKLSWTDMSETKFKIRTSSLISADASGVNNYIVNNRISVTAKVKPEYITNIKTLTLNGSETYTYLREETEEYLDCYVFNVSNIEVPFLNGNDIFAIHNAYNGHSLLNINANSFDIRVSRKLLTSGTVSALKEYLANYPITIYSYVE